MACEKKARYYFGNWYYGSNCYQRSERNKLVTQSKDLVACGMEYRFYIRDHWGNGIDNGHFKVTVDGVLVAQGGRGVFDTIKKEFSIPPPPPPTKPPFTGKFTSYAELKGAVKTWVMNKPWAVQRYGHISDWDVSHITSMRCLFSTSKWCPIGGPSDFEMRQKLQNFNEDLSKWDVAKVTNMSKMFDETPKFNSDISRWNVSKVKTFRSMFYGAHSFAQNLCQWDWRHPGWYPWISDPSHYSYHQNAGRYKRSDMFYNSGCPITKDPNTNNDHMCFTC